MVFHFLSKAYQEGREVFREDVERQEGTGKTLSWQTLGVAWRKENKKKENYHKNEGYTVKNIRGKMPCWKYINKDEYRLK